MPNWKYTNENGEKVTITNVQLKWLAQYGKITPTTILETEDGEKIPAQKADGLRFSARTTPAKYSLLVPETQPHRVLLTLDDDSEPTSLPVPPILTKKEEQTTQTQEDKQQGFLSIIGNCFWLLWLVVIVISPFLRGCTGSYESAKDEREAIATTESQQKLAQQNQQRIADAQKAREEQEKQRLAAIAGIEKLQKELADKISSAEAERQRIATENKSKFADIWTASAEGTSQDVEFFLKRGDDINGKDRNNVTPLETAVIHTNLDNVKFLVSYGAEVNVIDNEGLTPLHHAVFGRQSPRGRVEIVKILLNHSAKIEYRDISGKTPLHIAARSGCIETVKVLVESGADINATCANDLTPAEYAAGLSTREGDEVCAYLLSKRDVFSDVFPPTKEKNSEQENHDESKEALERFGPFIDIPWKVPLEGEYVEKDWIPPPGSLRQTSPTIIYKWRCIHNGTLLSITVETQKRTFNDKVKAVDVQPIY